MINSYIKINFIMSDSGTFEWCLCHSYDKNIGLTRKRVFFAPIVGVILTESAENYSMIRREKHK